MLKRILKLSLRFILVLLLTVGLYLLMAFSLSRVTVNNSFTNKSSGIVVFVISNGMHADIAVPASNSIKDWTADFPQDSFDVHDSDCAYIAFGWGDRGFYLNTPTWNDLTVSTALKAVIGWNRGLMHVRYLKTPNPSRRKSCVQLVLSEPEYKQLISQVEAGFAWNNNRIAKMAHPGYGEHDLFYEGTGRYSMFKTCNVWTDNCLKNSGIRVCIWSPFAKDLLLSLH